jgi:hypothetical protein
MRNFRFFCTLHSLVFVTKMQRRGKSCGGRSAARSKSSAGPFDRPINVAIRYATTLAFKNF